VEAARSHGMLVPMVPVLLLVLVLMVVAVVALVVVVVVVVVVACVMRMVRVVVGRRGGRRRRLRMVVTGGTVVSLGRSVGVRGVGPFEVGMGLVVVVVSVRMGPHVVRLVVGRRVVPMGSEQVVVGLALAGALQWLL